MRSLRGNLRSLFLLAVAGAVAGPTGCGNSCFVGFSNNGNGGIIIKGGNPPPACTLNQGQGMVRATVGKVQVCANCAPVMHVKHIYVVLRGVEIRADAKGDSESGDWIELAPQLNARPRRIDLVGPSIMEVLTENPRVPADTYAVLRLRFASEEDPTTGSAGALDSEVFEKTPNCVVMADGRIEPLAFSASSAEALLGTQAGSGPLIVVPGGTSELRIRLGLAGSADPAVPGNEQRLRLGGQFLVIREPMIE